MKSVVSVCLLVCPFVVALVTASQAETITATILGNVATGTDVNDNVFTVGNNLAGQTFKLVFTFDDTLGPQSFQICSGGAGFYSQITGTDSSATAQLYIPATAITPFQFGGIGLGWTSGGWYALQYAAITCSTYGDGATGYKVFANYGSGGYSGSSAVINDSLSPEIFPAFGDSFSSNFDWRTTLPSTGTDSGSTLPFNIDYTFGGTGYNASGTLGPTSLTISG